MTQGISQSLNLALARVNYIERSFAQLEGVALNSNSQVNTIESDFKKIYKLYLIYNCFSKFITIVYPRSFSLEQKP